MICVCLGSVGCLRFVCRYSLLILREAKNRELKKATNQTRIFTLCLRIPSRLCLQQCCQKQQQCAGYLFLHQPGCSEAEHDVLPSFPLLCACFCTCWAQAFPNMCITSREHQSYCVAELLHIPALSAPCSGQHKKKKKKTNLFAQSDFSTKAKLAEILRDHCCHCPKSLGKGILGTLLLHRALQLDISPLQPLPSSTSLYVGREKIAALKEREKKMRLRSQGHFNKHQT